MAHAGDDGFHEIQLSGKQLVFLCMATTVVAVLIFLCGVLVGRGVKAEKAPESTAAASAPAVEPLPTEEMVDPEPPPPGDEPAAPQAAESGGAAPPDTTYHERLESKEPPKETLSNEPPAQPKPEPARDTAARETPAAPAATTAPAPPADGFVVQVAALRDRTEAESIVRRLTAKGYSVFVVDPSPEASAPVFRVRVGPFPDRRAAEQAMRRIEKEEQFKPWITR